MRKMVWSLATVVAVLVLPQIATAEEPQRPLPPGPEMLFRLLDANHDGVISEDEIPADAPEPMKTLLKGADKNGDKKVSLEEFLAAVKEHPPAMPPFGMPMHGTPRGMMPPLGHNGPPAGFMPPGPPGLPHGGPMGKEPDLKALFAKMDKNKDGKLTVEEFSEGMKALHEEVKAHLPPMGQMPGPGMPMPPVPVPGMMMPPFPGMMPPPPPVPGMMMPHAGPGPGMMGGPMPGTGNFPSPAKALEARFSELEARLTVLEAKADVKK